MSWHVGPFSSWLSRSGMSARGKAPGVDWTPCRVGTVRAPATCFGNTTWDLEIGVMSAHIRLSGGLA